jgi:hypothetical protein
MLSASINIYTRQKLGGNIRPGGSDPCGSAPSGEPRTTAEMRLYKSVRPRALLSRGRPRALDIKPHPPSLP